ncbi:tRNA:m(4)X modification enzyme TRM13 homolog [Phymastichus coffea]|uniref:tRNA:m(4)X modification enzyme TRM13 homolog n=1 Tax=Phymastichus coffea TaxID=108790 RepID=UPI00273BB7C0|nr:tRNA:m(4)X modification enzyme TRM13 homolog [Phymastichus coffea]XP_058790638.1 tRNA:m(4)X modification enzyme TRM13 homolog [Phymastichus coffea]
MTDPKHCQFFLNRKNRFCRMTVKKDTRFCGEHLSSLEFNQRRIPCPLDSSHTCFQSKLQKHLKVCNAKNKQDMQPLYVVKGINLGEPEEFPDDIPFFLSSVNKSIIYSVLNKIKNAYVKLPEIPEKILNHEVLEQELKNPINGREAKRHLKQTASLLGHLKQANLIHENTCFIEFGAGRGKLSYWLAQAMKNQTNSSILLVDRSNHRHKLDNKLKDQNSKIKVVRVRADIADLKLSDIPEVKEKQCWVGVAKHVCGAATDLALRCITNAIPDTVGTKTGIVIAFCCHHQCIYSDYVGHNYLENEGFTKDDFPILCKIASWATCSNKLYTDNEDSEREATGRKAKTLLNWGRLEYLKDLGFTGSLLHYTSINSTLENMCLVATYEKRQCTKSNKLAN